MLALAVLATLPHSNGALDGLLGPHDHPATAAARPCSQEWCRTYTPVTGTADTLQANRPANAAQGYADRQQVEVTHCFAPYENKWDARWLMFTPGSELWFDLGKTLDARCGDSRSAQ